MSRRRGTGGQGDGTTEHTAPEPDRREAITAMGAAAFGAYSMGSPWRDAFAAARARGQSPTFFTDAERALVRVLADMIIPRDEKSGSATDSGAIEYMEFVLSESSDRVKQIWRDGIRWLDEESQRRFQAAFTTATETQRGEVLDAIAFPARAAEALRPQVEFFNRARDLTASAFFSSRMGVEDLGYMGGVFNPNWQGAPPEALAQLGVSYEEWDRRYGPAVRRSGGPSPSRPLRPSPRPGNHE